MVSRCVARCFVVKNIQSDGDNLFIFIDISCLVPFIPTQSKWFKLDKGGKGEVMLLLRFTPMPVPNNPKLGIYMRVRPFRMFLDRTDYFPGETVRGTVVCNIGYPIAIRAVRVKFTGTSYTSSLDAMSTRLFPCLFRW